MDASKPPHSLFERLDDLFARLQPTLAALIDRIKVFIEDAPTEASQKTPAD